MFLQTEDLFDGEAIETQLGVLIHPAADCGEWNGEQLRAQPRGGLLPSRKEGLNGLLAPVDRVVALILVVPKRRVEIDHVREAAHRVVELKRLPQLSCALSQRAFERRVFADALLKHLAVCLPRLPTWVDV